MLCAGSVAACAGAAAQWQAARDADTPAAYQRFLRTNPRSPHAAAARERLAVLAVLAEPTDAALADFRRRHPHSRWLRELEARVEEAAFLEARQSGTAAAWHAFLARHPDGAHAARARGNLVYVRARGFAHRPEALASFLAEHPDSDFAPAARRSLELIDLRRRQPFRTVRLELDVRVPDAPRAEEALRRRLASRARSSWEALGIPLVSPGAAAADAVLRITHREAAAPAPREGLPRRASVEAHTRMTLAAEGSAEPIAAGDLVLRGSEDERRRAGSLALGFRGPVYWQRLFVPLARWPSIHARRAVAHLRGDAVAVAAVPGQAVVLRADGSFEVWEVDPEPGAEPRLRYDRPRDLLRFAHVTHLGDSVVTYGEDGLEWVSLGGSAPRLRRALRRDAVGAVRGVVPLGDGLLVAGSRGLLRVSGDPVTPPQPLDPRPRIGMDGHGDRVALLTPGRLAWAPRASVVGSGEASGRRSVAIDRGIAPRAVRLGEDAALVLGLHGALCVSGLDRERPAVRRAPRQLGALRDGAVVDDVIFVLAERGLVLLDPATCTLIDGVDVAARARMAAWGPRVLVVDGTRLEQVDATPWLAGHAAPASAGP